MYLYNVNKLRRKILPSDKIDDNQELYNFLAFKHMIEEFNFKTLYMDPESYGTFVTEEQMFEFLYYIQEKFNYNYDIHSIYSIRTWIFNSIPIEYINFKDFSKKAQRIKPKKRKKNPNEIRKQVRHKYKAYLNNVKQIKHFKKIMSLDFEYKDDIITEAGVSFYIPSEDKLVHHHYLIKEHVIDKTDITLSNNQRNKARKQENFHFGKTRIISIEHLRRIVDELIEEADCLVGHNIQSDFKLLDFTIEDIRSRNKKIIDTFFLFPALTGEYPNHTLKELCTELDVNHSFMHNAGNDAAYTLICALRIFKNLRFWIAKGRKENLNESNLSE